MVPFAEMITLPEQQVVVKFDTVKVSNISWSADSLLAIIRIPEQERLQTVSDHRFMNSLLLIKRVEDENARYGRDYAAKQGKRLRNERILRAWKYRHGAVSP